MKFEVTELDRRISNLLRFGTVEQVDYAAVPPKVRVKAGDILTGWIPWLTQRAGGDISWDAPEINEQVLILAPSGELNQGVALAAVYQTAYPNPVATADKHHRLYKDGAVIEYDRAAHHLKAILPAGATVELTAPGGITINGDITLTGDIDMTGNVTMSGTLTADVDVIANGISLHNHKHGDVQSGSSQTGVPV